jgi:hypothetical protein
MSQFEDDRSQQPAAVAGTPDRLTAWAVRALDMYLRYEAAVTRHVALLEAVQSAHAHQTAILEAITMAWASQADAAAARAVSARGDAFGGRRAPQRRGASRAHTPFDP